MPDITLSIRAQNLASQQFARLEQDLQRSNRALRDVGTSASNANPAIARLRNEYRFLSNEVGNVAAVTRQFATTLNRSLQGTIDAAVNFERLRRSLETISGSAEVASEQYQRLIEVSRLPGLNLEQAIRASTQLQAIGREGEDAAEIITQFGNALALSGGSARDLNQITNAIRQMSAEGKILQEDLSIMTTRVAVLVPILEEAFGGVRAEDIRASGASAEEFIATVTQALAQLPRAGETAANAIENLSDTTARAQAAIGTQLLPAVREFTATAEGLVSSLENASPAVQRTIAIAGVLGTTFLTVTAGAAGLTAALPALGAGLTFLATNPIGIAITAIAAITAGIVAWRVATADVQTAQEQLATSLANQDYDAAVDGIDSVRMRIVELRAEIESLNQIEESALGRGFFGNIAEAFTNAGARERAVALNQVRQLEQTRAEADRAVLDSLRGATEQRGTGQTRGVVLGRQQVTAIRDLGRAFIDTGEDVERMEGLIHQLGITFDDIDNTLRDSTVTMQQFRVGVDETSEALANLRVPEGLDRGTFAERAAFNRRAQRETEQALRNTARIERELANERADAQEDASQRAIVARRRQANESVAAADRVTARFLDNLDERDSAAAQSRRERESAEREHQRTLQRVARETVDIIAATFTGDARFFNTFATGLEGAIRDGLDAFPDVFSQALDASLPFIGPFFEEFFSGLFESLTTPDVVDLGEPSITEAELFSGDFGTGLADVVPRLDFSDFDTEAISQAVANALDPFFIADPTVSARDFQLFPEHTPLTQDELIELYDRYNIPHNLERTAANTSNTADNTRNTDVALNTVSAVLAGSFEDLQQLIRDERDSPLADLIDQRQGLLRLFTQEGIQEFLVGANDLIEAQQQLVEEQVLARDEPEELALLQNLELLLREAGPIDPSRLPPGIEGLFDERGQFQGLEGFIGRIREALVADARGAPLDEAARADIVSDFQVLASSLNVLPESITAFSTQLDAALFGSLADLEVMLDPEAQAGLAEDAMAALDPEATVDVDDTATVPIEGQAFIEQLRGTFESFGVPAGTFEPILDRLGALFAQPIVSQEDINAITSQISEAFDSAGVEVGVAESTIQSLQGVFDSIISVEPTDDREIAVADTSDRMIGVEDTLNRPPIPVETPVVDGSQFLTDFEALWGRVLLPEMTGIIDAPLAELPPTTGVVTGSGIAVTGSGIAEGVTVAESLAMAEAAGEGLGIIAENVQEGLRIESPVMLSEETVARLERSSNIEGKTVNANILGTAEVTGTVGLTSGTQVQLAPGQVLSVRIENVDSLIQGLNDASAQDRTLGGRGLGEP